MTELTDRRKDDLGPLHSLLIRACVPDKDGNRSINILARRIDISANAVFKWIAKNQKGWLPADKAKVIVDLNKEHWDQVEKAGETVPDDARVSLDDFHEFVYS